ncbi:(2Fe-2S)-binding protein [Streptomyces sp. NPDC006879]|uniref:(2Fe-2S)-binding protein n=1 Tax=Streptomyces sp. NPDC006879 TaxID=3364767 RepID=UPI0036C56BCB
MTATATLPTTSRSCPAPASTPLPPSSGSPLTAAYTRLTEAYPGLRVEERSAALGAPSEDGWFSAAELAADPGALDSFLDFDETQVRRDYGQSARPDVVASFGLHRYAWPACLLVTVPWFLHRRVPRLPVSSVSVHRASGRMSVHIDTFACLPEDPAAALPGAEVVADEEALRTRVRASVAEHLQPLLEGFGPRMRRGRRALWGTATDEIVEGLWYVGQLLGEGPRAMVELERLLPGRTAPYTGAAGFRTLVGPQGQELPTRNRASCCLFYTIRPRDTCTTCPRTCDADRIGRLTDSP